MILPNGAVVAVIDGERIRLFRNNGHEPHIDLAPMPDPDLGSGNTGSGSRHRSSTANPDRSRIEEDDFAAAAAGHLNREALAGRIDHILIIADPRTLGELRKHFHDVLVAKLIGQLAKNLAGGTAESIRTAITAA